MQEEENKITLFDLTETSGSVLKTVKNIENTNNTIIVDMIQDTQEKVFTTSFTTFNKKNKNKNNKNKNNKAFDIEKVDEHKDGAPVNITLNNKSTKIYFKINAMTYIKLPNNFTITNDYLNEISIGDNEGKITLDLEKDDDIINTVTLRLPNHKLCFNIKQNNFTEYTYDSLQHFYFNADKERFIGKRSTYLKNLKLGFRRHNHGITTYYAWEGYLKGVMGIDVEGHNGTQCLCGKDCCSDEEIDDDSLYGGAKTLKDVKDIFSLKNITNSNDIKK